MRFRICSTTCTCIPFFDTIYTKHCVVFMNFGRGGGRSINLLKQHMNEQIYLNLNWMLLQCSMKILREFYFADWRFLWFAGTKFCGSRWLKFLVGTYFLRFSVQVAVRIFKWKKPNNTVFSTFILRYVESKFTLLTYLMENNMVITVISYCTKGLNNSKTKQKPIPTIHSKTLFR